MTLHDVAIKRRRGWREEGLAEGKELGEARDREALRREKTAAVLAADSLTPEEKNRFIPILNSESPAQSVPAQS